MGILTSARSLPDRLLQVAEKLLQAAVKDRVQALEAAVEAERRPPATVAAFLDRLAYVPLDATRADGFAAIRELKAAVRGAGFSSDWQPVTLDSSAQTFRFSDGVKDNTFSLSSGSGFTTTATGSGAMAGYTYSIDQNGTRKTVAHPKGVPPSDCWSIKGSTCDS